MDSNMSTCGFVDDQTYDMNETTTCGDADEVSSLCSWATDQGDDVEKYSGVGSHSAPGQVGNNNINALVWSYGQDGVSNGVSNSVPVPYLLYGSYMAAMPFMLCCVIGSDEIAMPLEPPGSWTDTTTPVSSGHHIKTPGWTPRQDAKGMQPPCVVRSDSGGVIDDSQNTTIILRNLPVECTRDMLLQILDAETFWGCYDFLHLPIDFQTKAGLGYALLNLVNHNAAARAKNHFSGFSRWSFYCENVCTVSWNSPQQGLATHIDRYRNSPLMHASVPETYRPVLFKNGVRVHFPAPTTKLRAPRIRHPKPGKAMSFC